MFDKVFEGDYNPGKDDIITVRMPETMLKVLIIMTDMNDGTGEKLIEKGAPDAFVKVLMLKCLNGLLKTELKDGKRETREEVVKDKNENTSDRKEKLRVDLEAMKKSHRLMIDMMERLLEKEG